MRRTKPVLLILCILGLLSIPITYDLSKDHGKIDRLLNACGRHDPVGRVPPLFRRIFLKAHASTIIIPGHLGVAAPSYDCSGTFNLCWDGDHASGDAYADYNSGAGSRTADTNTLEGIGSSYGRSGDGGYATNSGDNIGWDRVIDSFTTIDPAVGTWSVDVYLNASGQNQMIAMAYYDSSDRIMYGVQTANYIQCFHDMGADGETKTSTGQVPDTTWTTTACAWDGTNDKMALYIEGVGWEEWTGLTMGTAWDTAPPSEVRCGDNGIWAPDDYYFDHCWISATYDKV